MAVMQLCAGCHRSKQEAWCHVECLPLGKRMKLQKKQPFEWLCQACSAAATPAT